MKRELIIIFSILTIAFNFGNAQTSIPKAQSLFIYNFTRLIEWPQTYKTGDFIIGVLGSGQTATELGNTLSGKKVSTQAIKFVTFKSVGEIEKCHILFLPFSKSNDIDEVIAKLGNHGTLLVTEKSEMIDKGAVINFIVDGNTLKFELNLAEASKRGLNISNTLQNMAVK